MRPNYPEPPHNDFWSWNWRYSSPEIPDIVHPLLRKWVIGSPVATELAGTLSPAEMRDDVWLNWTSFSEKKNHLFSQSGALTIALNWSTGIWAGSLLAACIFGFSNEKRRSKLSKSVGVVTVCCIGLTGLIYLSLPKTEVRLVKVSFDEEIDKLYRLYECLIDSNPVTRAEISAKAEHYLSNPTKAARWENWDNPLIGGRIREEDSPGNFMLRENGNHLEFVAYDAQGAEHVLQDRWSRWDLRTQR